MRIVAALLILCASSGCLERGLGPCEPRDGAGNWVAVRVVWNGTNAPAPGACVRADRDGVVLAAETDDLGIAIVHLQDGLWRLTATLEDEDDPLCAHQGFRELDVRGSADVVVRLDGEVRLCA